MSSLVLKLRAAKLRQRAVWPDCRSTASYVFNFNFYCNVLLFHLATAIARSFEDRLEDWKWSSILITSPCCVTNFGNYGCPGGGSASSEGATASYLLKDRFQASFRVKERLLRIYWRTDFKLRFEWRSDCFVSIEGPISIGHSLR